MDSVRFSMDFLGMIGHLLISFYNIKKRYHPSVKKKARLPGKGEAGWPTDYSR